MRGGGGGRSSSINKDPDWIGGFFLSSCLRPFPVRRSPLGTPLCSSQEAEAQGGVRVGAPGPHGGLAGAPGLRGRYSWTGLSPVCPGAARGPRLTRAWVLGLPTPAAFPCSGLPHSQQVRGSAPGICGRGACCAWTPQCPARPSYLKILLDLEGLSELESHSSVLLSF